MKGFDVLRINEFAILCECNVYTLRYYDKIGLLKPSVVNADSGYRFYKKEQVFEFIKIKQFQEIGFSNNDIKLINKMNDEEVIKEITIKINEIIELLEKALEVLKQYSDE